MNGPDYLAAAAALFNAFTLNQLLPLVSLVFMAVLLVRILQKAQQNKTFDVGDFLRGQDGKASWHRIIGFLCFMVHTWVVFARTVADKITVEELALYCLTWSGTATLVQGMEAWKSVRLAPAQPVQTQQGESQ